MGVNIHGGFHENIRCGDRFDIRVGHDCDLCGGIGEGFGFERHPWRGLQHEPGECQGRGGEYAGPDAGQTG